MVASRKIYQPLDLKSNAIVDAAISFTDDGTAAVGVITDSRGTPTGLEFSSDLSATFTARSLTDKAYVDSILATNDAMILKGVLDASGANQLPTGDAGDTYKISVAGNFNGTTEDLQIGDTVYCLTDSTSANTPANWVFIQNNLESASETAEGFIELATQAEVDAGSDTTRAVTAATLEGKKATAAEITAGVANSYVAASSVIDEDSFASNLDTKVPTQQSVRAYVDAQVSGTGTFTSNALSIGPSANAGDPVIVNHALVSNNLNVEVFEVTAVTASTIAFVDSNPDTITDSANGFAVFSAGQIIDVSGSGSNDGQFTVASAVAGTITLIGGDSLAVESAGASITISAREKVDVSVVTSGTNNIAVDSNTDIVVDITVLSV